MQVLNENLKKPMILGRYYLILVITLAVWSANLGASIPTFEQVSSAVHVVRGWINSDLTLSKSSTGLDIDDETSVCLIIRHHGEVLGVGTANGEVNNPVALAAEIAFSEINRNAHFNNVPLEFRQHVLASMSIELELGGKPIPSPNKHIDRFARSINIGIDGIAVRKENRWAVRLPAEMRLVSIKKITSIIESLCITVGVHPATALSRKLPPQDDITLYTIPTITAVQEHDHKVPQMLISGDELVLITSIDQQGLIDLADSLASHLINCTNSEGSTTDGYQPETDTFSPPAPPTTQVMIASALAEYSKVKGVTYSTTSQTTSSLILEHIATNVHENSPIKEEFAASIVMMLAVHHSKQNETVQDMYARCRQSVINAASAISAGESEKKKPRLLAMLVASITAIAIQENDMELRLLAESTCLASLKQIQLASRVSTIPWMTDAMLELMETGSELDVTPIIELLDIALATQVKDDARPDLLGGFALSTPQGIVVDVRGIRMVPMLARLMITPTLDTSRSEIIQSLILAARFTAQLTTREGKSRRFQNPTIAKGGVRASTWDASMPTEATAMALIGISRAITSFRVAAQLH